jgi:hypothetical protein
MSKSTCPRNGVTELPGQAEIFFLFVFLLVRTVTTVIGKVPVDSECTSMLGKVHVYCENHDVFDCMLNQVENLCYD